MWLPADPGKGAEDVREPIPTGSATASWDISSTGGINDRGVIAAQANIVSNGLDISAADAVLLVPSAPDDAVAYGETHKAVVPDDVWKQVRERAYVGHFRSRVTPQEGLHRQAAHLTANVA